MYMYVITDYICFKRVDERTLPTAIDWSLYMDIPIQILSGLSIKHVYIPTSYFYKPGP